MIIRELSTWKGTRLIARMALVDESQYTHSHWAQGAESIQICYLTRIEKLIVEIRRSYDRFISVTGFPMLISHLYIACFFCNSLSSISPWLPLMFQVHECVNANHLHVIEIWRHLRDNRRHHPCKIRLYRSRQHFVTVAVFFTAVIIAITWWRHQMVTFSALLALCAVIHRSLVNSLHKGQWRGALVFSLVCT